MNLYLAIYRKLDDNGRPLVQIETSDETVARNIARGAPVDYKLIAFTDLTPDENEVVDYSFVLEDVALGDPQPVLSVTERSIQAGGKAVGVGRFEA